MPKKHLLIICTLISIPLLVEAADTFESAQDLNGAWSCTTYAARNDGDARCAPSGNLLFTKQGVVTFNAADKTWSYAGTSPNDGFEGCRSQMASSGKYDVQANHLVLQGQLGAAVYPLGRPNATTFTGHLYPMSSFFVCKKNK